MSDELFVCKCGFKCVYGQLAKTDGYCPKCGNGRADLLEKFKAASYSKRVI